MIDEITDQLAARLKSRIANIEAPTHISIGALESASTSEQVNVHGLTKKGLEAVCGFYSDLRCSNLQKSLKKSCERRVAKDDVYWNRQSGLSTHGIGKSLKFPRALVETAALDYVKLGAKILSAELDQTHLACAHYWLGRFYDAATSSPGKRPQHSNQKVAIMRGIARELVLEQQKLNPGQSFPHPDDVVTKALGYDDRRTIEKKAAKTPQ